MLIGLHFQYHLEIVVLERVVGQGFASVQVNGPWQLSHTASAEALMYMTKIFTSRLYLHYGIPSSLSFMQSLCSGNDSSILAVTEGCQLSIWDLRMKEMVVVCIGYMVLLEISSMQSVVLQLVLQWEELIVLLPSTILADG
ncbi:hypothetical protein ACSBR1_013388 [Camellia fascicularis]